MLCGAKSSFQMSLRVESPMDSWLQRPCFLLNCPQVCTVDDQVRKGPVFEYMSTAPLVDEETKRQEWERVQWPG